jgi:chromosome segregation protein
MKELVNVVLVNFFLVDQASLSIERVTGVFGPNGSGKSAVLDAIQIAMMGANGNQISLNAQADDKSVRRSPRRIRDYVLGRYGVEDGEEARESAVSYVTLVFRDTVTQEPLSMGVCLAAQRGRDDHETLGRYVLPGVALSLNDHVARQGDETMPLEWAAFQVELERKSSISGAKEIVFPDSDRFGRAYLLAMRSTEGQAQLEAFRKAFRFALRMRFDQTVEEIVKTQVLEARTVDIKKFKEIVNSFGQLRALVAKLKEKIKAASDVKQHFDRAKAELCKAATWKALAADAHSELAIEAHETALVNVANATEAREKVQRDLAETQDKKTFAEREQERLGALITSHAAHQKQGTALAQLEEKEAALARGKSEFRKSTILLSRLLESVATSGSVPGLEGQLRQEAVKLDRWAGIEIEQAGRHEAVAALSPPISALSRAFAALSDTLAKLAAQQQDLETKRDRLQNNLERARGGRATLTDDVTDIQRALSDAGIRTEPVCDLVRVKDPQWQPAIESYLGRNREALLIWNPTEEEAAFEIYRGRKRVYGVKLVLASQNHTVHAPAAGTVAELLVGDNVPALVYLRSLFGSTVRATDSRAVKQNRALTPDAMLVSSGAFERLRPVDFLLLGGGRTDAEQVTHLSRELEAARRELERVGRLIKEVKELQGQLGLFADTETGLETVLHRFDTLLAVHEDVEILRLMLADAADEEYADLVAQQSAQRKLAKELDDRVSALRERVGGALERVNVMRGRADDAAFAAEAGRQAAAKLREDGNFDPEIALSGWDQLLRECSGALDEMATRASHITEAASRASLSALNRASNDLGTFIVNFAEQLPETSRDEDPDRAWRASAAWLDELLARLQSTDLPNYAEQIEQAYKTAQDTFRNDVAVKIHENLVYMKRQLENLNEVLRACPPFSNGERYAFHRKLKPEHRALYDFIEDVGTGGDADFFSDSSNVPKEFRDLIEQSTEIGNASVKTPLQDYREFFMFDIEVFHEDPVTRAPKRTTFLSRRLGPSSGGEHRAPLYVIAGAALASAYRIMKGATSGLRLMLLDEAFDKMDDTNTISTLRYLEDLGLQVVLAGPGKDIGVLNAFLYRYYEVSRDPENQSMSFAAHSLTQESRDLNRSDRYEFHPELLEAEIRAMAAVERPKSSALA